MPDTVACIDGTYPTQIVVPLGAKNIPAKVFTFFYSLQIVIYHLWQKFTTVKVTVRNFYQHFEVSIWLHQPCSNITPNDAVSDQI